MTLKILIFFLLIRKIVTYNLDINYPIIYEKPDKESRISYFGLSVLIRPEASLLHNTPVWYLQVGAPRCNVSSVKIKEPGCVYRCATYGNCEKYKVDEDESGSGGYGIYKYIDKKDEAFIGISMDMKEAKHPRLSEKIVICGHRWSNQHRSNPENIALTYLMTGVCYLHDDINSIASEKNQKLLPLVNQNNIYTPKPFNLHISVYNWGIGQMGTSVELSDNLTYVLMGAPGIYNWRGSVVQYEIDTKISKVGNFENFKFSYAYIGYQVGSGKFFGDNKLWFVTSAPRSADYHGQVIIFQFQDKSGRVKIATTLIGSTFGEYFGASITVSDINSDGKDDLIVGAPSYSFREPEEGRIYVFLGTNRDSLLIHSQVISGKIGYGRFGSCVSSIGDLDQDGYLDLAVGAPYENDNRGAVYIYHGYAKGLQTQYSQKIKASDVYDGLRGFGISISKGVDVDANLYKDIAIGSYLSDHVVLLRSRPIVSLHPYIEHEIKLLDRRAIFFNVTFCSKYLGPNVGELKVSRTVVIDPNYGRAKIFPSWLLEETKTVLLNFNKPHCEELHLLLDPQAMNRSYSNPIEIFLSNDLPKCGEDKQQILLVGDENLNRERQDGFSPWCPLGKSSETSIKVPFAGECGADNVCKADLDIFCSISEARNNLYVIGTSNHINLNIKLKNNQEPAYDVGVKVHSNLLLVDNEDNFYQKWEVNQNDAEMNVDTFFGANFERELNLEISTEQIKQRKILGDYLNVTVKASTSSSEDITNNNECHLSVKLICDIQVELYASSSPKTVSISEAQENPIINLTHYYEVKKIGESPATDAELFIYIPTYFFGTEIVNVETEYSDWMYSVHVKRNEITDLNRNEGYNPQTTPLTNIETPPSNRTLFLNCSTPNVQCSTLEITFPDGIPTGISSFSNVFIKFNFSAIEPFMGDNDIVHFTTNAVLKVPQHFNPDPVILFANASSTFFQDKTSKPLDLYVIALSVLGGGLLLSLIISGLFKGNFFKRTKKEELEALKQAEMFDMQQKPMIPETDC